MVHIIPLSVARRRGDAGNAVRHADASPAGEAGRPLDEYWQAVAEHHQQRMAQQQAFDTEIAARRLDREIASAEADTTANAPADGEGLHHAMYGEVDRHSGRVVQKGRFDTLFDDFIKQAPPELRAGLASRKPALREAGSVRMAVRQLERRSQYEQDHLAAVQAEELDAIAKSDPDDMPAFETARRAGLDLIAKMNLDAESRQKAEAAWRESTARTRLEALIARDPKRAAEMPSAGSMAGDGMSGTVSMPPSAGAPDESGAVKGDRVDSRSDLSANDASYASDIFNRLVPTYGNYGGPGWTGGAWGGDFKPPAIDIQDGFYRQHDEGYHDAASLDDVIAADRQLVASLDEYLKNGSYWDDPALNTNKDRILAAIYAEGASRVFQAKISALMVARGGAQKTYDDARSAVGRSQFINTMTFGKW